MKRLMVYMFIIFICFYMQKVYAQSQWDYSQITVLQSEAQRLIENQQPTAGYALFEEILFLIRIEKGLYSIDQVPYLLEYMRWNKIIGDWEKTLNLGQRTSWLLNRNENQIDNYRRLLLEHLHVPEDDSCLDRDEDTGNFIRSANKCSALRFFMANTFIAATIIQQRVVHITNNEMDWESLKNLAEITAYLVYGVDGTPILIEIRENEYSMTKNPTIRERYRPDTWLRIAEEADINIK